MAKGFAAAGYTAYALDIRGHGASGTKGHIAYIGQLEDDMEDFVHSTKLAHLLRWSGSLPVVALCFDSRAARDRSCSLTTFCSLPSSAWMQPHRAQAAAGGSAWGFRGSSQSPCSMASGYVRSTISR